MSASELRIILIILSLVVLALIYWFGKPGRKPQGRRRTPPRGERVEPTLDGATDADPAESGEAPAEPVQSELNVAAPDGAGAEATARPPIPAITVPRRSVHGRRPDDSLPQRIVSVLVVALGEDRMFHGPDIVVAADKAGLEYGDMGIFHRLVNGKPELGPVFSAASMVTPGNFDMTAIRELKTPGLTLFMGLPGPLPALDAWDTMLPTARRLAELLDGQVVDDQHNALGRQRVAYIRDDLRAWDRKHEA